MPITSKPEVKKRSQRWVQANEEMKEYQRQLAVLYPDAKQQVSNKDHTSLFWFIDFKGALLRYGEFLWPGTKLLFIEGNLKIEVY